MKLFNMLSKTNKKDYNNFNNKKTKNVTFKVAGTSHYANEIKSLGKYNKLIKMSKKEMINKDIQKIYEYTFPDFDVKLVDEPDNKYNSNAIMVLFNNIKIGYIKDGSITKVRNLMNNAKILKITGTISGGKCKFLDVYEGDLILTEEEKNYTCKIIVTMLDE